jgi:tRNA A37 threonylcarbamoyladenosine modification protein TsaB
MKSLFVISIASPLLVGIYENENLIETISKEGKTSDILPIIVQDVLKKHTIDEIIYVNGPGSYMAIKIAYIFLKTITIIHKIKLKAVEGFSVNNNSPIKALGKKYFIKSEDTIIVDFLSEDTKLEVFTLPTSLDNLDFKEGELPEYHLPAIT